MKVYTAVIAFAFLIIVLCTWICWKFQFRMQAGKAVKIQSGHIGICDYEIWQRKNSTYTEPFATGLFVKTQGGPWRAFLIDFEDTYRPRIRISQTNSGFVIYENHNSGIFNEAQQTYRRSVDIAPDTGVLLDADPPGKWWLNP